MEKVEFGSSVIFCGNAFDILPTLEDGIIDNVVSDPPYGITAHPWDQVPPLDTMWRLFEAKSKDNANFVLFGCGGFTIDLINSKRPWYRYDLTWVKNNKTGWMNSGLMVHRNHENVLLFGKPGHQKTATFNVPEGYTHPCSVLAFDHERGNNQQGKNFHQTQKPLMLMGYLLTLYSNPGDIILDPFAGSGTTLDAALRLNRRFIGIERERNFFDTACRRLEAAHRQKGRYKPRTSAPVDPADVNETADEAESAVPPA